MPGGDKLPVKCGGSFSNSATLTAGSDCLLGIQLNRRAGGDKLDGRVVIVPLILLSLSSDFAPFLRSAGGATFDLRGSTTSLRRPLVESFRLTVFAALSLSASSTASSAASSAVKYPSSFLNSILARKVFGSITLGPGDTGAPFVTTKEPILYVPVCE
jgi:hypothetical protein